MTNFIGGYILEGNKIWRINMKTDGIKRHSKEELMKFCLDQGIIGIGWSSPVFTENLNENEYADQ